VKDDLSSVPTIDELAATRRSARDLELETMKALLVEHAVTWCLERGRVTYGDRLEWCRTKTDYDGGIKCQSKMRRAGSF
jgi:hypothetical protein